MHPYASQRQPGFGNFVGAIMTNNDTITDSLPLQEESKCPHECRENQHIDWEYY